MGLRAHGISHSRHVMQPQSLLPTRLQQLPMPLHCACPLQLSGDVMKQSRLSMQRQSQEPLGS